MSVLSIKSYFLKNIDGSLKSLNLAHLAWPALTTHMFLKGKEEGVVLLDGTN